MFCSLYHVVMSRSVLAVRFLILISLLFLIGLIWYQAEAINLNHSQNLKVRFLDVGQGDSVYVVTPDGYELLIDGGPSAAVLGKISKYKSFFDRSIDMVLATHYDTDHIGGLVDVLSRYEIDWIIESGATSDTPAAQAFDLAVDNEGAKIIKAQSGQVIKLGAYVTLKIFSPLGDAGNWESNTASAVVQVVYGDIELMLTGDAPLSIEEYLVDYYRSELESEVLKLGHHGSKTSSSENFIKTVAPKYAVVSAGKNNRYGHPHQEVVERVLNNNISLVSTIDSGTITFVSDGKKVWQE